MQTLRGVRYRHSMAITRTIELRTALPGPRSQELLERKTRAVANAKTIALPVVAADAQGVAITDVDGNVLIDFTGGVGCLNVGHAHPRRSSRRCRSRRLASSTPTSPSSPTRTTSRSRSDCSSARRLHGPAKAAFFNAGTEAVENAVKFARLYTRRPAVVAFEGAFHGRTLLSMTLTSKPHPYKAGMGPFAPEVYRVPFPQRLPRPRLDDRARRAEVAVRDAGRRRAGRRDRDRARARRGRLHARPAGVHERTPRPLRRARDRPRRGRGADRLRVARASSSRSSTTASSPT